MFVYFTPQASAPDVNRTNLKDKAVCVDEAAKNQFLWAVRRELGLTVWINPRGPVKQPELECFWYPKALAERVLESLEHNSDYQAYVKVAKGIRSYIAAAKTEYREAQENYILRRAARRAGVQTDQKALLKLEAEQHDLIRNRGRH